MILLCLKQLLVGTVNILFNVDFSMLFQHKSYIEKCYHNHFTITSIIGPPHQPAVVGAGADVNDVNISDFKNSYEFQYYF